MGKELVADNGAGALAHKDPAAIAAAESVKARIQSAYWMAVNRPRNVDSARAAILKECSRPAFAEKAEYSKPVGGKRIRGPSVRLAELALRLWGNVLTDTQVVMKTLKSRESKSL